MKQAGYYYELAEKKTDWASGDLKQAVDFISAQRGSVLDVGCGQSKLSQYIPAKFAYTGLDPSLEAKPTVVGVAEHMPFPDETFDIVFSSHTLQMLQNPRQGLMEFMRVTKPGGFVIIIAPNLERPWATIPATRHYGKSQHFMLFLWRSVDSLSRAVGYLPFRTLQQNYVQATGRFERGDDDLVYITSAYEVTQLFRRHSFSIIRRNGYLDGGMFMIAKKPSV